MTEAIEGKHVRRIQVAAKWGKDDKLIIMCQQGLRCVRHTPGLLLGAQLLSGAGGASSVCSPVGYAPTCGWLR